MSLATIPQRIPQRISKHQNNTQVTAIRTTLEPVTKIATAAQPKTFTFRDPTPSLLAADWEPQPMSADQSYVLLQADKGKSLADVLKDNSIPVLAVSAKLWREIRYVVEKNPNHECAMFLCLKRLDENRPHFLAFDMFMPGQDVSGGAVSLDGEDCDKYFNALKDGVPYFKENGLHRHLCHLHSHGRNGVFWSSIDDKQQLSREDLGFMDDFRFYVVVNAAGGLKASFVSYSPVLQRIDAAVVLSFAETEFITPLTKARKKELDAILDDVLVGKNQAKWPTAWDASSLGIGCGFGHDDWYGGLYNGRHASSKNVAPARKVIPVTGSNSNISNREKDAIIDGPGRNTKRLAALYYLVRALGIDELNQSAVDDTLGFNIDRELFAHEAGITYTPEMTDRLLAFMVEAVDSVPGIYEYLESMGDMCAEFGGYAYNLLSAIEKCDFTSAGDTAEVCRPSEHTLLYLSELPKNPKDITEDQIVNLQDHITEDLQGFFMVQEEMYNV